MLHFTAEQRLPYVYVSASSQGYDISDMPLCNAALSFSGRDFVYIYICMYVQVEMKTHAGLYANE